MKKAQPILVIIVLLAVISGGCQFVNSQPTPTAEPVEVPPTEIAPESSATPAAGEPPAPLPTKPEVIPAVPTEETLGDEPEVIPAVPTEQTLAEEPVATLDGLDRLLIQHSIRLELHADHGDGAIRSLTAEIDSDGNVHILNTLSGGADPALGESVQEIYVIEGTAYTQDGEDSAWTEVPGLESYLVRALHGSNGPGMWLGLLPEGSLQPDGSENTGGFAAERYTVSGEIDEQTVTGTVWIDPDSRALVKAELNLPRALFSSPDQPTDGTVSILFSATRAEVEAIKLP